MDAITAGVIANLLTQMGVKAASRVFGPEGPRFIPGTGTTESQGQGADEAAVGPTESGETARFLTRQRFRHRVDLARAKWDWLVIATYYHPTRGRPSSLPTEWLPTSIGGEFTTSDFASRETPFEIDLGENAPSSIRTRVLHGRIAIAANLAESIDFLENELARAMPSLRWPEPPWAFPEIAPAWATLLCEVQDRQFADLSNFNAFCGFSNLFAMTDTPASGVQPRKGSAASVFAFSGAMELAWRLIQMDEEVGPLYSAEFRKATAVPHQYALRRCASRVLKKIWQEGIISASRGTVKKGV